MDAITTTNRLVLRKFETSDAPDLYKLNSDPEVMRYTGDPVFSDPASAETFIHEYDHYQKHGYGRWAVCLKDSGEFIGFCGLKKNDAGETDLGFRFYRRYWAKGYATEAANAALTIGFNQYGLDEILGPAMRENLASITVLQKLGMRFCEVREEEGTLWLIYCITNQEFNSQALP